MKSRSPSTEPWGAPCVRVRFCVAYRNLPCSVSAVGFKSPSLQYQHLILIKLSQQLLKIPKRYRIYKRHEIQQEKQILGLETSKLSDLTNDLSTYYLTNVQVLSVILYFLSFCVCGIIKSLSRSENQLQHHEIWQLRNFCPSFITVVFMKNGF